MTETVHPAVPEEAVRAVTAVIPNWADLPHGIGGADFAGDVQTILGTLLAAGWVLVPGPVEEETAWLWPDGDVREDLPSELGYEPTELRDEEVAPVYRLVTEWRLVTGWQPAPEPAKEDR